MIVAKKYASAALSLKFYGLQFPSLFNDLTYSSLCRNRSTISFSWSFRTPPFNLRLYCASFRSFSTENNVENNVESKSFHEVKADLISRHRSIDLKKQDIENSRQNLFGTDGKENEIAKLQDQLKDLMGEHRLQEAKDVGQVLKDVVAGFFGEKHPVYASTLNNIGMIHRMGFEWDEALECYTEAIRVYRDSLGDKHQNTVVAIENHAHVYKALALSKKGMERLQLLESARELFEEALQTKEAALGDWNVQVGMSMQSLGSVLRLLGNFERASKLVFEGSEMIRKLHPRNHAMVATSFNNLAYDQKMTGEFDKAEENYKEAFEIRQALFGDDHPETILVMNNMAELYLAQDKQDDAAVWQNKILDIVGCEDEIDKMDEMDEIETTENWNGQKT